MFIHSLHRAGQCADDIASTALANAELTTRQFMILKAIADRPGCNQTALIAATGIDRSTMADVVRRLVERGLIRRERDELDQRAYTIFLTENGRHAYTSLDRAWEQAERELLQALPETDRMTFVRTLRRIVDHFGPVSSAVTIKAYQE